MFRLSTIELERRSVFYINSLLIILMIVFFQFNISTEIFFYINILITFILSYLFFKKSKKLSKYLIITNLFIFTYFMYPHVSMYLYNFLGKASYIYILFYNILIAYIFLIFSGHHKDFARNLKKFNIKIFSIVILIGMVFGIMFFLVKEPVAIEFLFDNSWTSYIIQVFFFSLILAISEQVIFSGFLFNIYNQLTDKKESYFQVATIFVLFHLLRFENLVINYFTNFRSNYLILITLYYIFLFLFMLVALYLYSFKSRKYSGTFAYPVALHFITDFTMLILVKLISGY